MILQSLTEYYEALARRGELARPGWGSAKISFALELSPNGELLSVLPLFVTVQDKKKTVQRPREFLAPAAEKRSAGIAPNFLWDNAAYMTGFPKADEEKEVVNARKRFEAMRDYHLRLLADCHSEIAHAIVSYFQNWNPDEAAGHPMLAQYRKELAGGANLTFYCGGVYAVAEPEMAQVWQSQYDGEEGETSVCLVTGKAGVPQAVHPPVKGLYGAQSSGAAIVSFNADAFTSYGKKQSLNAPVSKYAAFAYTEALNYLLKEPHCHKRIGDTTFTYWAEDADPGGSDFLSAWYDSDDSETIKQEDMDYVLRRLASGLPVDREGLSIQPDNHFYILALAPNAARVSVRFFLTDTFGHLAKNLLRHYARMEIVGAKPMIPVWQMVNATVRAKDGKTIGEPDSHLSGDLIRAILEGSRYPDTLYQRLILRIRTEQNITPTRAALIKAYLLNNECMTHKIYEEVLTVKLNEETTYLPYVLGELFALLEEIQERASGVTTIKDRFYTSACTTPAVVFPRVIDLAEKHLKKLDKAMQIHYAKELNRLIGMMDESFPAHLSLQDQGVFQIGYYHRKEKRFEKKDAAEN